MPRGTKASRRFFAQAHKTKIRKTGGYIVQHSDGRVTEIAGRPDREDSDDFEFTAAEINAIKRVPAHDRRVMGFFRGAPEWAEAKGHDIIDSENPYVTDDRSQTASDWITVHSSIKSLPPDQADELWRMKMPGRDEHTLAAIKWIYAWFDGELEGVSSRSANTILKGFLGREKEKFQASAYAGNAVFPFRGVLYDTEKKRDKAIRRYDKAAAARMQQSKKLRTAAAAAREAEQADLDEKWLDNSDENLADTQAAFRRLAFTKRGFGSRKRLVGVTRLVEIEQVLEWVLEEVEAVVKVYFTTDDAVVDMAALKDLRKNYTDLHLERLEIQEQERRRERRRIQKAKKAREEYINRQDFDDERWLREMDRQRRDALLEKAVDEWKVRHGAVKSNGAPMDIEFPIWLARLPRAEFQAYANWRRRTENAIRNS